MNQYTRKELEAEYISTARDNAELDKKLEACMDELEPHRYIARENKINKYKRLMSAGKTRKRKRKRKTRRRTKPKKITIVGYPSCDYYIKARRRKRKTKKRRKTRRKKRKYKTKRKRRNSRKRTKSLKGGWFMDKSYNHLNVQHSGNGFIHVVWWGGRMTIGKVKHFCAQYLGLRNHNNVTIWLYGDDRAVPNYVTMNQLGLRKGSTVGMTIG